MTQKVGILCKVDLEALLEALQRMVWASTERELCERHVRILEDIVWSVKKKLDRPEIGTKSWK